VERVDAAQGSAPVERVRMIPWLGGGLAAVLRGGLVDLVQLDHGGALTPAGSLAAEGVAAVEIAPLGERALLAHVDGGAEDRIGLELRDAEGTVLGTASIAAGEPIVELTSLPSKAGDAVLLGWTTQSGKLQLARVGCTEGT
jgi:hypothetical protein